MSRLLLLACVLAVPLVPLPAPAQTVPSRLTLEDALSLARQNNPALKRAHADQAVHESATLQAWGQVLPRVNLSANSSLGSSTAITGQDAFGRPVSLEQAEHYRSSSAGQSAGLTMTLFDGGRSLRSIGAARARERAGEASVLAESRRIEANVTRAYYRASSLEQRVDLEQRILQSAEEDLERTEALLRIAGANHPDVLGARSQVAGARQSLNRAEAEAAKAKLALLELLGVGGDATFTLTAELPEAFDPAEFDVERLVAGATANSPSVLQAQANAVAARRNTAAQKGSRWPSISASAGFSRSMSLRSFEAFGELNPQNRGISFTLSASLPVFNQFQTRHSIITAWTGEQNALEDARAAVLAAEREVRAAFIDLESAYEGLQLARERAELERERLGMAEEQYRLGGITYIILQQHIDQTAAVERAALEALVTFAEALVTLEERAAAPVGR